jgi:hypothetical protein
MQAVRALAMRVAAQVTWLAAIEVVSTSLATFFKRADRLAVERFSVVAFRDSRVPRGQRRSTRWLNFGNRMTTDDSS